MGNPTPRGEGVGGLMDTIRDLARRVRDLERPTGTSVASLVEQVQKALADITTTVANAISAQSYTRTQIDARVANPPSVAASGPVSGTTGTFPNGIYSTDARNFVVTTNYAASWIDVNGHLGISPSTLRFKKDVEDWDEEDVERLFSIAPKKYRLRIPDREQITTGADGEEYFDIIPGFEDPEDAPLRPGFIAEDLVAAGAEEVVVFDEDGLPVSINYAEWVVPLQMMVRHLHAQRAIDRAAIADLTRRLESLEGASA